jgi:hypothetical protein
MQWATDDYIQPGPFGPNVTRDEFEAGNREIGWKALPDISIQLELVLPDGELVAARAVCSASSRPDPQPKPEPAGSSPSAKKSSPGRHMRVPAAKRDLRHGALNP